MRKAWLDTALRGLASWAKKIHHSGICDGPRGKIEGVRYWGGRRGLLALITMVQRVRDCEGKLVGRVVLRMCVFCV